MATRKEFCDAMNEVWKGHGVYIGAANGEFTEKLTIGKIKSLENSYPDRDHGIDIRRDLTFIGKCYENGYDMSRSRAGDCSGIIVGVMRDLNIIKSTADYSASGFQSASSAVPIKSLRGGDLVFNKTNSASHVGVYVGNEMVIESKGRDDGVVKRKVSEGGWVVGGRLDWFSDDIPELTRNLRYIKGNLMRGEDVRECQERLIVKGYDPGDIDGAYGIKTMDAVIEFQTDHHLEVDGVVGQKTWNELWR